MTQIRKLEYLADDSTFDLNTKEVGIIDPGVYRGFGVQLKTTSDLILRRAHTGDGASYVNKLSILVENIGVIKTKQGVLINETETVEITITTNLASLNPRIDTIIVEHEYDEIEGGNPALYSVIEGTPSSDPVAPGLTDPDKQIKIGELYIPAGCEDLSDSDVQWVRELTPKFAGQSDSFVAAEYVTVDSKLYSREKNRSGYYVKFPSPTNETFQVSEIDLCTKVGITVSVISNQPLYFSNNAAIKTPDSGLVIIRPYEEARITYLVSVFGVASYIVMAGGDLKRSLSNKLYRTLKLNNSLTTAFGTVNANAVELKDDGNVVEIDLSSGNDVKYIKSLYDGGSFIGDPNGALVVLTLNIAAGSFNLTHNAGSVPSGYKSIMFPWCASVPVFACNQSVTLVMYENDAVWNCIGMIGSNYNPLDLRLKILSLTVNDLVDVVNSTPSDNDILIFDSILEVYKNENLFSLIQDTGLAMTKPIKLSNAAYTAVISASQLRINPDKQIHILTVPSDETIISITGLTGDALPAGYSFMINLVNVTGGSPLAMSFSGGGNLKTTYPAGFTSPVDTSYLLSLGETFFGWSDGTNVWLIGTGMVNYKVQRLETQNVVSAWKTVGNDSGETAYATGWSNAGGGTLRSLSYRKNKNFIEIHGQCTGSGSATATVFTLPIAYRPAYMGSCEIVLVDGTTYSLLPVQIGVDGLVKVYEATYSSAIYQFNVRIPID